MIRRRKIILRAETLRVLAPRQLRGAAGGMEPSDEAGYCGYTQSWCESYVVCGSATSCNVLCI
jgi:hypothetical protein